MEEPLSQSSSPGSGTYLSNVSGFSLGEAIVQRAKQDTEFCPLLQMNTDTGEMTSSTASHLLSAGAECTQTLEEIPTMEEGTITITEETSPQREFGQFQTLQRFELQESILSPALALVTACSTQSGLSLSLLHRSSLEFAPLRAAPDLSVASHEGSRAAFQANNLLQTPILEVLADCKKGSLSISPPPSRDGSEAWVLSQHPLMPPNPGSETTEDEDFTHMHSYIQDQRFMELPSRLLGRELHGVSDPDLRPSLGWELPTCPCSQEMDLPRHSVHETEGNRPPSAQQSQMQPGAVIHGTVVPEQEAASQQGCNTEPLQNPGDPAVSAITVPDRGRTADEADQTSCPDASQEAPSTGALPASITMGAVTSSAESLSPNNSKGDTSVEVLTCGSSREQAHEDSQSPPTTCAEIDSSFTPPVAGPIYQSTPASVASKVLHPSGQCGQEARPQPTTAGPSRVPLAPAFVKLESSGASEEPATVGWGCAPRPHCNGQPLSTGTRRQSSLGTGPPLPPLSHVEKVGAWNRPSFDNLVLHGVRDISPRQRAYGAIADSLGHMFVRFSGMLTSDPQPTRSVVATLRGAPRPAECLHSARASDGPGNSLQADSGRESPDHGPLCEHNSSLRSAKDGGPVLEGSGSQPSRGTSPLDPRPSARPEKDSVDQSPSEYHVISPGPARIFPLNTASVEDAIDPPASSLDTSQAGEHTLTMSGHSLTSLEVDNYVPAWGPPSLTPESNHFNIDDRIPDYLRNLGINQSPSSILGSKGPLRAMELDLHELRNLRETAMEGFQAEEGVSAMDRDSECTFHSDVLTHSTSIPLGSEAGRISACPSELSLGTAERSVLEPAVSQWPMSSVSTQHPPQALSLLGESVDEGRGRTPPFPGRTLTQDSLVGESVEEGRVRTQDSLVRESVDKGRGRTPPFPGRTLTQDSLVGVSMDVGRTLTHDWSTSRRLDLLLSVSDSDTRRHSALFVSSPGSVGESAIPAAAGDGMEPRPLPSDSSPRRNDSFVGSETLSEIRKLLGKAGGILDSGQGEAAVLGGEDGGELVCRQDWPKLAEATEVRAVILQPPRSRDPGAALRPKSPARTAARGRWRQAGRDEPEGCRGAASGGGVSGSDLAQGHPASSQSSGGQAVLPQLPGPTRRAWVHASHSDSGDTIEASSHTDSLDARNSSPLPAQGPTEVVKRLSTTDLDKEPSTQGWEGTKQSMRLPDPLSMLSEEDRRRIEEIKAELLQQSKTSVSSQALWLEEAEDWSPASDSSQSARSFTTFRSLDTARSQICSQLQGASDTTVEPRTPLRGNMERLPEAVCVPRTDCPPPIAAITFSSRRKPLSASPLPTAALLTPPPTGHGEPLGRTHPPAAKVPSEPRHGEQLAGKMALSPAKAAPLRLAARTVLSLSPNRPDTPTVRSADHPSSSGKPPFPASDGQGTAKAPRPSLPPQDPVLGSASPLYPPWPMPMPALWSTFPPSFNRSSEAGLPSTGEPPSQARIFAAQDANKVDVSTQTSGQTPSSPVAPPPSEAQRQDGQSRIERTPSIPAPMTGGATAVSSCASTTDGPMMLPYKPAGSSRLFYVANARLRQRSALVVSENGSELSRPGAVPHRSLLSAGTVSFERLPTRDPRGGVPDPSSVQGHWRNQQQRQREDGSRQTPASVTVRQAWPDLRVQRDEDWPDPHERGKQDWPDPHMQAAANWTDPRERGEEDWSDPHERKEEDWSDSHEQEEENWPDPCEQMAEPGLTYKELAKAAARSAHAEGSPGNGVPGPGDPQWWVGTEDPRWGADPRLPLRRGVERGPLLQSGADLRPPRQSVADPGPPRQSVADPGPPRWSGVDHRPLRRSAVDPGPPWWGGAEPGPPQQDGADPGPPRRSAADLGPPRRSAADLGPPRRSAADLGPPRRSAADLGPPRRSAADLGPPRRSGADPGPPRRSAADPGPPRQVVDLGPPRRGDDPGPPWWGGAGPGPPQRSGAGLGPPRRGGVGPGPPRRGGAGLGPPRRGGPLDQLWERLKERQQQQQSVGSSTDSELSLLERLHQLAQFLRAPLQTRTPSSSASPADDSTDRILEHRLCALPGTSESDTASTPSTIDTARLIRAFGPERVLPLARLYSTIQQQKESSAHRRERRRRGETRHPATRTAQQADSISPTTSNSAAAGRRCTRPLRGRSSRLVARKGARLVDQGVQAGSLEIVPGATRRQTRDVGVTFPSPDSDLDPHRRAGRWELSASLSPAPSTQQPAVGGRKRRDKVRCLTDSRQGEGTRKPAVAWFVPAHELQGDGRKENVPVPRQRPVEAWGLREAGPPWRREPLRQIHLQGSWNPAAGGKSPYAFVPLTLREALGVNRPWFISRSRERQRRLALRTQERRFQNLLQSERERLFNPPSAPGSRSRRGQRTDCSILYKKMISKQEMLARSRRLYEQLPEVTRRRDEEKRRTESRTNRLRAQLYKQKITNRILGKKVSWQ